MIGKKHLIKFTHSTMLFKKRSIGLDIADHTIEVVELLKSSGKIKLVNSARVQLESGVVERGRIKNAEKLSAVIKKLFSDAKPQVIRLKELVFSLPESQVYTHTFSLQGKKFKDHELDSLVLKEIQTNIPLEEKDTLFSYKILSQVDGNTEILSVSTSREVVLEWKSFFKKLDIEVEFFDIENLAIFRDLFKKIPDKPVCVVDIGAVTTNISIFDNGYLHYSYSINMAGVAFTKEIANTLQIDDQEAEKRKVEISSIQGDKDIPSILSKNFGIIVQEIKISINYFKEKFGEEVGEVVLVGGSSQLKGLVDYLANQLNLSVHLGESKLFLDKLPLFYIEAVGLALKGLMSKKEFDKDPVISIPDIKLPKLSKSAKLPKLDKPEKIDDKKSETGDLNSVDQVENSTDKTHSRSLMLFIILIIGVILIVLAFWYRSYDQAKRLEKVKYTMFDIDIVNNLTI